MTPRPGGEAAKRGVDYESAWTVRCALEVLRGAAEAITVEPEGPLGDGVELILERREGVEAHQVKRQHGLRTWTVAALAEAGVLSAARLQTDAGRDFHFISIVPCVPLWELSERARGASDAARLYEALPDPLLRDVRYLETQVWDSTEVTHRVLRRLHLTWPSDTDLRRMNATLAAVVLEGADGPALTAVLADVLLRELGRRLDAGGLLDALAGYGVRAPTSRRAAADAVATASASWLARARDLLLDPAIARDEADRLHEMITGAEHPLIFVAGAAGSGKTGVLADVVHRLAGAKIPVLALRLDGVASVSTPAGLGEELALDRPPVAALAAAAGDAPCVLVIDQIDAASSLSGRGGLLIDAVRETVREASGFPSMRVVLACRSFDLANDERFRELRVAGQPPAKLIVGDLDEDDVAAAVRAMGLDPRVLSREQRDLLRSPFHLVLLEQIRSEGAEASAFAGAKDLLDSYWRTKRRACQRERAVRFDEAIFRLARRMSDSGSLVVAESALDGELARDVDVLASEGVLRWSAGKLAFFHEAFFDYAFARAWMQESRDLVAFLRDGDQGLFRRAQVRQILVHLHEDDPERFASEFEALLASREVRFHLKHVAAAVVGALPRPTAAAWRAVSATLGTAPEPVAQRLRASLRTPGWFERLTAEGALARWLADERMRDQAFGILADAAKAAPDRVAAVLRPHAGKSSFEQWIRDAARFADLSASRSLFELVLDSVRRGVWNGHERLLWMYTDDLAAQPMWAVELLEALFVDREGALQLSDGRVVAIAGRIQSGAELVAAAANGAPLAFWERLGPWLLRVMEATRDGDGLPLRDRHFSPRSYPLRREHVDEALLAGAADALRVLAAGEAALADSELLALLQPLARDPHDSAQWLLYEALRSAAPRLVDAAADILLEGPARLRCGYRTDRYRATRDLLAAISPHVGASRFEALEAAVLAYRRPGERPGEHASQHTLLDGLALERLSDRGRRRRLELERQYGPVVPPAPAYSVGTVRSPVPERATPHMTDDDWLRALTKYADQRRDERDFLVGGAEQLAAQLRDATKGEPERFAELGLRLDAEPPAYLGAILGGLRETERAVTPEIVFSLVRHVIALGHPEHERWLGDALRPVLGEPVPADVLEALIERALHARDPEPGAAPIITSTSREDDADDHPLTDAFTDGMNRARGSLVLALADLLIHDGDGSRAAAIAPYLDRLARDPSPSVRACVARLLATALPHAEREALAAYPVVAADQDEALATMPFEDLTLRIAFRDTAPAVAIIERMLVSDHDRVRRSGGKLAAYVALELGHLWLLEPVRGADAQTRRGAAAMCARRIAITRDPGSAAAATRAFLRDDDEKVRAAAARVAIALRGEALRHHADLLHDLIEGPAFDDAVTQLLITLDDAPDRVDDLVLAAATRLVGERRSELGDLRTAAAADARHLCTLVTRAYAQAASSAARTQALDLIDLLLLAGAYGIEDALGDAER